MHLRLTQWEKFLHTPDKTDNRAALAARPLELCKADLRRNEVATVEIDC